MEAKWKNDNNYYSFRLSALRCNWPLQMYIRRVLGVRCRHHPSRSSFNPFTHPTSWAPIMFSIAKKAASRLRFANIFNRAIGLTMNATTAYNHVAEHLFEPECTPSTRHHSRGHRSRRRRVPGPYFNPNATTSADPEVVPNSRLMTNLRDQYRGATEVRTRVRKHNELRKERSLQRVLRTEGAATPPRSSSTASSREFHILAENVQQALVTSEVPKTREDVIFERGFAELVGDFVAARKVVDAEFAKEVACTFDQIDEEDFMAQLNEERARVESAMAVKEAVGKTEMEERERERREEEERQKEKELEKIRRVNQAQIREAEERRAEARRKADEEDRIRRLRQEHEVRLREERRLRDQEHKARVEAERIARLERERVSRLEEEARLAREREEQRRRDEKQARVRIEAEAAKLRAAKDEKARREAEQQAQASRRLDEYVQSILDPGVLNGVNERFRAQEIRFREQLEAAARAQAAAEAQAQGHRFYAQPEHYWQQQQHPTQDSWSDFIQDSPMGEPDTDVSMASIPDDPIVPLPKSDSEWFNLYESRWQELRGPNSDELAFPSFPWPVFQLIQSLDELADEDIRRFFAAKYPGKLDKNWKVELTRWHPDKVERLRNRIRQDCVEFVRMGFLRCTMVMNAFQEEREADRT